MVTMIRSMLVALLVWMGQAGASGAYPYLSFNGMYHNPTHTTWGSTGEPLSQPVRPVFSDGAYKASYEDRASARQISVNLFDESIGTVEADFSKNYTALLPFFMQFMDRDLLDLTAHCPPQPLSIEIPEGDPFFSNSSGSKMPMDRVSFNTKSGHWPDFPRQHINEATSWIDASQVYGISKSWSDLLRTGQGGLMAEGDGIWSAKNTWGVPLEAKVQPTTLTYPNTKEYYLFGDRRSNENPAILALHWLFFKEHNRIARELKDSLPTATHDKVLFDKARFLTIGKIQKVFQDAVEELLGHALPVYKTDDPISGYYPSVRPGISQLYAGALHYFYLTMIPDKFSFFMLDKNDQSKCDPLGRQKPERICNWYWDAQRLYDDVTPEDVLVGLIVQPSMEIDTTFTPDVRSYYWGPMEWTRRDAVALAIQRGRDLGVPPLNTVLEYYGLPALSTWDDWTKEVDNSTAEKLKELYPSGPDSVELFVGGMLLAKKDGRMPLVFRWILYEQFMSLRHGDRFWYQNEINGMELSQDEIANITATTLKSILEANEIFLRDIDDPFKFDTSNNCLEKVTERPLVDECLGEILLEYSYNTTPYAIPILLPSFLVFAVVLVIVMRQYSKNIQNPSTKSKAESYSHEPYGIVTELQSKVGDRVVDVVFDSKNSTIALLSNGKKVRTFSFDGVMVIKCSDNRKDLLLSIPKEYDVYLRFGSKAAASAFLNRIENFCLECDIKYPVSSLPTKRLLAIAKTEAHRQHLINKFLASAFSEMMKQESGFLDDGEEGMKDVEKLVLKDTHKTAIMECELTRCEFAAALGLNPTSEFVAKVFPLVDRDNNGSVSFKEFLSFMIVYSARGSDDKLKLIFNMYDVDKNGSLHVDEIKAMLRSMLELVSASVETGELNTLITSLFVQAGYQEKTELSFAEFKRLMAGYESDLANASIGFSGGATTTEHRRHSKAKHGERKLNFFTKRSPKVGIFKRYIENHRLEAFYSLMFLLVIAILFFERFVTYTKYREHTGYPELLGYSLSLTRGSAAVLMFCFPCFLLMMCKNIITHLRGTFLKRYIPLDSNRHGHILLGYVTFIFILIHCIGHGYNFYMISTLSPDHLSCMMPRTWLSGTSAATVTGLLFGTITGITGVLLVLALLIMYIFSTEYARRYLFSWFWKSHHLYPVVLLLTVLHGTARLLQEPTFHYYLIGPGFIFILDKLVSVSRRKREVPLIEANILPSEVTNLVFKRPEDFHYLSGQYVRIALVNSGTGRDEYHPFTLTSAPHEDTLSVHIRTCKGWTRVLRELVIRDEKCPEKNPNLYVDGPFGEAHQDYSNYEVVVLIGGGIGVTPFASIVKDLVHRRNTHQSSLSKVKKVYFFWASRSQKQFEWLLDILGKCEREDTKGILDNHIFITRFYDKSDLRTTILYICERQFQGVSNRSMFTGLKAITHFGRPNFDKIFEDLRQTHEDVRKFGVFVCGPPAMSDSVKESCSKITGKQTFVAYAENF